MTVSKNFEDENKNENKSNNNQDITNQLSDADIHLWLNSLLPWTISLKMHWRSCINADFRNRCNQIRIEKSLFNKESLEKNLSRYQDGLSKLKSQGLWINSEAYPATTKKVSPHPFGATQTGRGIINIISNSLNHLVQPRISIPAFSLVLVVLGLGIWNSSLMTEKGTPEFSAKGASNTHSLGIHLISRNGSLEKSHAELNVILNQGDTLQIIPQSQGREYLAVFSAEKKEISDYPVDIDINFPLLTNFSEIVSTTHLPPALVPDSGSNILICASSTQAISLEVLKEKAKQILENRSHWQAGYAELWDGVYYQIFLIEVGSEK